MAEELEECPKARAQGWHAQQVHVCAGIAIIATAIGARILTLNIATFDADEFAFAMVARDVLRGKLPYSGVFDNKPVGLTYVFALAEWLGNRSLLAIHSIGLIATIAACVVFYATARQLRLSKSVSIALVALSSVGILCLGGWASMSELVAAPLLALANLLLLRLGGGSRRSLAGIGCAFGLACQVTYLAVPVTVLSSIGIMLAGRDTVSAPLRRGVWLAIAFCAVTVTVWLPQMVAGVWLRYIVDQLSYHAQYRVPFPGFWEWLKGFLLPLAALCAPLIVAACWNRRRRDVPGEFLPPALGVLGAVVAAVASNRYYSHYLILAVPYVVVLAAMLWPTDSVSGSRRSATTLIVGAAIAVLGQTPYLLDRLRDPGIEGKTEHLIHQLAGKAGAMFVFNETPALYYLTGSDPVGRYIFPNHYIPTCDGSAPLAQAKDVLEEGLKARPELVLIGAECDLGLDADAATKGAGYHLAGKAIEHDREVDVYLLHLGGSAG